MKENITRTTKLAPVNLKHAAAISLLLISTTQACDCDPTPPEDAPPNKTGIGQAIIPNMEPPERRDAPPLTVDPALLPPGAVAHFPAHDGDRFFVTLPVTTSEKLDPQTVLTQTIEPILAAIGFSRGISALNIPEAPTELPRANLKALTALLEHEYRSHDNFGERTKEMIDAFSGNSEPSSAVDLALQIGEGMTFSQFVAGIERLAIVYPFQQVDGDVPIEHSLVLASSWEQQGITSVRGVVYDRYRITNNVVLSPEDARDAGARALAAISPIQGVSQKKENAPIELVLLPYGGDASAIELRYAYRTRLFAKLYDQEGEFQLWVDAEKGELLELESFFSDVTAAGATYNRDPGLGSTISYFQVDAASSSQYILRLNGVLNRVDYLGNGFDANDVAISDSTNGSSGSFANFDQSPINDVAQALCNSGTNKSFQQVNFYGSLHRYYADSLGLGVFTPFPTSPWDPKVQSASAGCNAWGSMDYGACQGYYSTMCPSYSNGTDWGTDPFTALDNAMNFAHDNTVVGHELAHNVTPRMTSGRPNNWCCSTPTCTPACPMPLGWGDFHDIADFWADHWESTNCVSGWTTKNVGAVDRYLNCAQHVEDGFLPRLHLVTTPFDPSAPEDHFPEHRDGGNTGDYADGQVAAAALWQVRVGMRSKCRPSGIPQFGVRFARALREAGFLGAVSGTHDRARYERLYDLEMEMFEQWATAGSPSGPPAFAHNGAHTTNKVLSGFARAGIFLIPRQCIDSNTGTSDPTACPGGELGGDVVVDIDDQETADDLTVGGIVQPEYDFLRSGGPAPLFHVWTGSRYRFNASNEATLEDPAPCHAKLRVEVANDAAFTSGLIDSGWIDVSRDPASTNGGCYGTWSPNNTQWSALQSGGSMIYYRAFSRDAADGNERSSLSPAAGIRSVPAPYAVITADGRSDY